jgi:hypothetical protein
MLCLLLIILLAKPSGIIYVQVSMILLYMTGSSILTLQINNSEEAVSVNKIFSFHNQNNLTSAHNSTIGIHSTIKVELLF